MSSERLSQSLLALLGPDGLIRLAELKGGTRLYVSAGGALADALGADAAARLAERYAGVTIRVPLARELRARHYRAAGQSNAEIARRLGMSESGIDRLFNGMPNKPAKGGGDQLDLFSS